MDTATTSPIEVLRTRLANPTLRPLTVLTDRSRTIQGDRCPRSRFWGYEYLGLGVVTERTPLYFIFGDAIHVGVGALLKPLKERDVMPSRDDARKAIDDAVVHFQTRCMNDRPSDMEMDLQQADRLAGDMAMAEFTYEGEQSALLEGLLWAWYFRRLPRFAETYRVLELEEEDTIKLGEYDRVLADNGDGVPVEVWFQARADALLEERTTQGLYVLSLKSSTGWDARKARLGNTDMQGVSEAYCVEQRLRRSILGIQMEYLIKGRRDNKGGFFETYNPVIRGWTERADSPGVGTNRFWRYQWQDELGNVKRLSQKYKPYRPWFSAEMGVEAWVELLANGSVQAEAGDPMAEILISPEYYRQERQMRSWFVSMGREVERKRKAEELNAILQNHKTVDGSFVAGLTAGDLMDQSFPQFTHSCEYPTSCPLKPLCFGTDAPAAVDPLGFQDEEGVVKYQWRVPHHASEQELVKIEGAE